MKNYPLKNFSFLLFCFLSLFFLAGCPSSSDSDGDASGDNSSDTGTNSGLFSHQWHLKNTGQSAFASGTGTAGEDINQEAAFSSGLTGAGVIVAVVDSGLEIAHADLSANVVSGQSWDFANLDNDPTNAATDGDHGTSVAGLIAALDNSIGGRGVAPSASLKGFNFLASNQLTSEHIDALGGSSADPHSADVHIFNLSYGSENTDDAAISSTFEAHLVSMVNTLRSGKGAIFVKAAGNGFETLGESTYNCRYANTAGLSCQNANMDPTSATPWVINVGALDAGGARSSYSTAGSAIWISAPGGEYGYDEAVKPGLVDKAYEPAMLTTDQSGCTRGYANTTVSTTEPENSFENNANGLNENCNFTATFNGTSSAAPVVSGGIALILEANPDLTWRDVKHILAATARQVDTTQDGVTVALGDGDYQANLGWVTNSAGYKFHNWYGFGAMDVDAAVTMARSYTSALGTLTSTDTSADSLSLSIPDNDKDGVTNVLEISGNLTIESVQVKISVIHGWTGDVGVELLSPDGTNSILFNVGNGFYSSNNFAEMAMLSNAFYGESSAGNWTLKVVDGDYQMSGTLTGWQLTIYGH